MIVPDLVLSLILVLASSTVVLRFSWLAVAQHILDWSASDGGAAVENMGFPLEFTLNKGPSNWVPTSLINQQQKPLLPKWGENRPFAMETGNGCPLPAPPAYSEEKGSDFYQEALEVYETVKNLTPEQRDAVARRDVWLVHPWALGEPPPDLPASCVRVGLRMAEHHNAWPWSAARWAFVNTRMAELTPLRWHADRQSLTQALAGARSVQTLADPHVSALLPPQVVQREAANLFPEVRMHCTSFSAWWNRTTRGVKTLGDLPGLAAG